METFYDKKYISREPVRYLHDVFSVGYVFMFSKQLSVTPVLRYDLKNKSYKKNMNKVNTRVDGLHKIVFGPLYFNELKETVNPSNIRLSIEFGDIKSRKVIFKKNIKALDMANYSRKPYYNTFNFTFAVCSCFNLGKYFVPGSTDFRTLKKFNDVCKDKKPQMIISSGDIVYLGDSNVSSSYAIQNAYDTLITLKETESMWSNYTWVCVNDDHELSMNDGMRNSENLQLCRNKLDENFPIGEQIIYQYGFRSTYFNMKNVSFIILDTVTKRTINDDDVNVKKGYKYKSILGSTQLSFFKEYLNNIVAHHGRHSLIFIVVGKSMFGDSPGTFAHDCVNEKDTIFNYIKTFRLRNVVFICGDTHLSDFTEYKLDDYTVREIRNSSVTSLPSKTLLDNSFQYKDSLSLENNFGMVNVNGKVNKYTVTYTNYTLKGEQFKYSWTME
jgi:hypothetical protein